MSHTAFHSRSFVFSTWFLTALASLSACEVAQNKRAPAATSAKAILPYFASLQYAIDADANFAKLFSSIQGQVIVAEADSNFDTLTSPQLGVCRFASEEKLNLSGNLRSIDAGDLKLSGTQGGGSITLPKNSKDYAWGAAGSLAKDVEYEVETTGNTQGQLSFRQKFKVLPASTNITLKSGINGAETKLPTPAVIDSRSLEFVSVELDKFSTTTLAYVAPAGTDYVKATFWNSQDATPYDRVVCYGSPSGPIEVPAESFKSFKSTGDGLLEIDFISVSRRTDITKVKESLILSTTRQIHGRKDYYDANSVRQPQYFGQLIYR